jgi:hypothetical protein
MTEGPKEYSKVNSKLPKISTVNLSCMTKGPKEYSMGEQQITKDQYSKFIMHDQMA